jgi:hypothetical protein
MSIAVTPGLRARDEREACRPAGLVVLARLGCLPSARERETWGELRSSPHHLAAADDEAKAR